jgi:tetratricopeptide (TPR) repeat protein
MADLMELLHQVDAELTAGNQDAAERILNEALAMPAVWPERGNALYVAGRVAMAQRNPRRAIEVLTECTRLSYAVNDPAPRAHYLLGLAYRCLGYDNLARVSYDTAVNQAKASGSEEVRLYALHNLAALCCRMSRLEEAETARDQAYLLLMKLHGNCDDPHHRLVDWHLKLLRSQAVERLGAWQETQGMASDEKQPVGIRAQAALMELRLLVSLGDVEAAQDRLGNVHALVTQTGYIWLENDLREFSAQLVRPSV